MRKYYKKRRRKKRYRIIKIKNTKDLIERSKIKHFGAYTYKLTRYIDSKTNVDVTCKLHGWFSIKPNKLLSKRGGCPKCATMSNGEIKTALFLKANKIKYIQEYKLPGYSWRYDFYLPDLAIVIEYDGIQHFKAVRKFGGNKKLALGIQRDLDKNDLASLHKLNMIRIPYTKYDVLEDYLLFKLSKIYKYKNNNKYYKTFTKLCSALKLPEDTKISDVKKYLTYNKQNKQS